MTRHSRLVSSFGALTLTLALALAGPAEAQQPARTAVAARQLERGHVISAEDIREIAGGAAAARVASRESSVAIGWVTRRIIAAGEPLREPSVAPPSAIESGQAVVVVWRDAGIEVRVKGVAASAAPLGGRIAVRVEGSSRSTSRRLEGVVIGSGLVQIK